MVNRRIAGFAIASMVAVGVVGSTVWPHVDASGAAATQPCVPNSADGHCEVQPIPATDDATTTTTTAVAAPTSVTTDPVVETPAGSDAPGSVETPETAVSTSAPSTIGDGIVVEISPPAVPDTISGALAVLPPEIVGFETVCFAEDAPESGVILGEFRNISEVPYTLVVTIDGPLADEKTIVVPSDGDDIFAAVAFSGLPPGSYIVTATNDAGSADRELDIESCPEPPPPTPGCTVALRDDVYVVRPSDRLVVEAPGVLLNDETCGFPALASTFVRPSGEVSFPAPDFAGGLVRRSYLVSPSPGVTHEAALTIVVAGEPCTLGESDADFVVVAGETVAIPYSHIFDTDCPDAVEVRTVDGLEHGDVEFGNRELLYTPDAGFLGIDVVEVVARRHGTFTPVLRPTVTIHVVPAPPCASSVADDAFQVAAGTTLQLPAPSGPAANDVVCDGDVFEVVSPPSAGEVKLGPSGDLTYVAEPDFTGTVAFTYRLVAGTDQGGPSLSATVPAAATTAPATVTIVVAAGEPPPTSAPQPPPPTSPPVPSTSPVDGPPAPGDTTPPSTPTISPTSTPTGSPAAPEGRLPATR